MSKEKKIRKEFLKYDKFYFISENHSEAEAKALADKALSAKKWAHKDFVKGLAAAEVKTQKLYIPVYKSVCSVEYAFVKEGGETENLSRRIEKISTAAPTAFKAETYSGEISEADESKKSEALAALYPDCLIKTEKNKKLLRKSLKQFDAGNCKVNKEEYEYAVLFVPVLKITYAFGDKSYDATVNLNNGACEADYPVSPSLSVGVEKTVKTAKSARRYSFFALLFAIVFAGLAWYKRLAIDESAVACSMAALLSGLTALPLVSSLSTLAFKRKKLTAEAKEKGKIKKPTGAAFFTVLSWACAIASVVIFALEVL